MCHSFSQAAENSAGIGNPKNVYMLKANNKDTRKKCGICSKLIKKSP